MSHRPALDQRFRPREHLRLEKDFDRVFAARSKAADDGLVVFVVANGLAWSRLGISVSKRLGNAVRRHYVRRRIREAYRRIKAELPKGLDIVCIARAPAADRKTDLARSLRTLVAKAASRPHLSNFRVSVSNQSRGRKPADPANPKKKG